ncbi:hypothetical protein LSM04_003450 [Trypanosoma melophagium]|uniref:uncharacterized protein n=1 Tax=Trypanosoma melophagium TaxID=715481 RepID=UPI00351A058F|nr:hypothetical protein LSM04_003450 [Trypanosoma melophagium]
MQTIQRDKSSRSVIFEDSSMLNAANGNILPESTISIITEIEMQQGGFSNTSFPDNDQEKDKKHVSWSEWFGQNLSSLFRNVYAGWNAAFWLAWEHRLYEKDIDFFADQSNEDNDMRNGKRNRRSSWPDTLEEV